MCYVNRNFCEKSLVDGNFCLSLLCRWGRRNPNPSLANPTTPFEMMNLTAPQAHAVQQAAENLLDAAAVVRNMNVADGVFVSYRANAIEKMERKGKHLMNVATNLVVADCALALALDAQGFGLQSETALESLADYSDDVASDVKLVRWLYGQAARLLA